MKRFVEKIISKYKWHVCNTLILSLKTNTATSIWFTLSDEDPIGRAFADQVHPERNVVSRTIMKIICKQIKDVQENDEDLGSFGITNKTMNCVFGCE